MKFLIHALGADVGGAARHISSLVPALRRLGGPDEFVVLVRRQLGVEGGDGISVTAIDDGVTASAWRRIAYDWSLGVTARDFDAIVTLTNFGPIVTRIPHVVFARNALYYTNLMGFAFSTRARLDITAKRAAAYQMMKRARVVVTPSDAMARMVLRTHPALDPSHVRTLYHACDFSSTAAALAPHLAEELSRPGLKLLYPTHAAPHKGFEVLFEVLARVARHRTDWTLFATIDDADWPEGITTFRRTVSRLGLADRFVMLGRVKGSDMPALYRACDVMVYPSLVESFGFSMVEAMSTGLPIVAAGTDINREICGDAAAYYAPRDVEEGAEVLLATFDRSRRAALGQAGVARAAVFPGDWDRYARAFVDVARSAAA